MAGGVHALNRYNLKCPEVKIFFKAHLFLTECIRNIYLVNDFYKRNVVLGGFQSKRKSTLLFVVVF
jgi:hypothetical protein